MATARLSIRRKANKDNLFGIVILISHKSANTEMSLKTFIEKKYWDAENEKIKRGCPQVDNVRAENRRIFNILDDVLDSIEDLEDARKINTMTAMQIREYYANGGSLKPQVNFLEYLENYIPKISNKGTRDRYADTLSILEDYCNEVLFFSDITKPWLYRFKEWRLKNCAPATVNIDLRNIRAVFNRAIDVDEVVGQELYPFRKFEFAEAAPRNLRLPIEVIKAIRDYKTKDKYISLARDFFMLSFYLIGMNNSDIYQIATITEGRIEYKRRKTKKGYTIKVEPEAMQIIERRRGVNKFLIYQERYANYKNLTKQMNKHLKTLSTKICESLKDQNPIKTQVPKDLVMYHARHSWAGIAAKKPIGAQKPLIAQALGHGKITVTDTYFDYDTELVDDLNRQVLDLLKE